jgi:hypothetical protein
MNYQKNSSKKEKPQKEKKQKLKNKGVVCHAACWYTLNK